MAGVNLSVTHTIRDGTAALNELIGRVRDLRVPFHAVGEYLLREIDDRFRRQQAPDGTPWAPNSEVTLLLWLQRHNGYLSKKPTKTGGRTLTQKGMKALVNKKILRDTGALQDTIRYQAAPMELEVGSNRVYAAMQQFGGTKAQHPQLFGDIPARPFLGFTAADRAETLEILLDYLRAPPRRGRG